MSSDAPLLSDEILPGAVRLTLHRPDKLNALSTEMIALLEAAIDRAAVDATVRAVVLTGAGERAFAAGADIVEYRGHRDAAFVSYQLTSRRVFDKLAALPKPTIAAIRGYALGGGFELALCCDIILCAESARLGLPEGRLGLCPGGGGTQRLARAIGRHIAADILLAGRRITGERAFALGLAAEVCPDAELDKVVLKRARAILKLAPLAQAEMKRLLRLGQDAPLPVGQSLEQEILFRLYRSADAQEGIAAFLDKREPTFRGE